MSDPERRARLREVAAVFLRLGATAFGGPAAHVAYLEREVVQARGWLSREEFLDLYAAAQLIPGPNSTELAIHLGYLRAGWAGLVVAGACFIAPAALIVAALAWAYVRAGALPQTGAVLWGMRPVILAVVGHALYKLSRSAIRDVPAALVAVAATAASLAGIHELVVLFAAAVMIAAARRAGPSLVLPAAPAVPIVIGAVPFSLSALFLFFLKIGSVLFGSGYVLLAFLRGDLVERWHWLTERQLLDAITVGQVTPGPVFTTATFVGWLVGGPAGASLATAGIFLPAFVFVALSGWLVPRLRRSRLAAALLDGLQLGSLGLMVAVTVGLGRAAVVDLPTVALGLGALGLLVWRERLDPAWLLLGGALVGLAAHRGT